MTDFPLTQPLTKFFCLSLYPYIHELYILYDIIKIIIKHFEKINWRKIENEMKNKSDKAVIERARLMNDSPPDNKFQNI